MSDLTARSKHQVRRVIGLTRRTKQGVKNRLSIQRQFVFNIDNPRKLLVEKKTIEVEGWIFSKSNKKFEIRVRNNKHTYPLTPDKKRLDVVKTHPSIEKSRVLHCGFYQEFEFEDGDLVIEVNLGKGFKTLYATKIAYGTGELPRDIYNKDLSNNFPEHLNLLDNRKQFYYESGDDSPDYIRHKNDARLVAIYLPQFHPFDHQQPILPSDLGFYDLRLESTLKDQIDLAQRYGIYGFSFYYYWFSGQKLMERPLEMLMNHPEWDFNFTICWANENWTKRWDGRDNDIIIAQKYLDDDPLKFIKDVEHILNDPRYITEDGKPVLAVYRASELKDPAKYADVWRSYFKEKYGKELQLVSYVSFEDKDPREYGFDIALDFAPLSAFFKNRLFKNSQFPYIDISNKLLDVNFSGIVADYRTIALNEKLDQSFDFPLYPCVTPSWDNDARKKGKGFVYQNSNPDLYAAWLDRVVSKSLLTQKQPLVFINAWNEWAEGAMLEPSTHLGHSVLRRTKEVLAARSFDDRNSMAIPPYGVQNAAGKKLAVIVHLYYEELWDQIAPRLEMIPDTFDVFVSLGRHNKDFVPKLKRKDVSIHASVLPNRGRDVLPFLYMLRRVERAGYTHMLKIHSKKSEWRQDGSSWFGDILKDLLPDSETIGAALKILDEEMTGVIGPSNHLVSLKRHMGSNKLILKDLIDRAHGSSVTSKVMRSTERYPYVGGTMFWARVDSLQALMDLELMPDDFPSEQGQIDGTIAHAIERFMGVSPKISGKSMYLMSKDSIGRVEDRSYESKYDFAP
jgi:lipopolysaccharide biosynthesis protein